MGERRSGRLPGISSPLTLLRETEPAHHSVCTATARVTVGGAHHAALERTRGALANLMAELGHEEFLSAEAPRAGP